MDTERPENSNSTSEQEMEIIEVLSELREAVFAHRPTDVYQFCASYFNAKLAEQREGLLELVKMNPDILDSTPVTTAITSTARTTAQSTSTGASDDKATPSVANSQFKSFGSTAHINEASDNSKFDNDDGNSDNNKVGSGTNNNTDGGNNNHTDTLAASATNISGQQQSAGTPHESGPEASGGLGTPQSQMQQPSLDTWAVGGSDSAPGFINPNFSFGTAPAEANDGDGDAMKVDIEEEARDKFSRLVSIPPVGGGVQPFAGRRFSVSAESMNPTTEPEYERKFVPKSEDQKKRIKAALDNNFLFKNLDEDSYRDVIDAMEEKRVESDSDVIIQGGVGDYFYIVEMGTFDIFVKKESDQPNKVATVGNGGSFGELALMYNAPRAATVHATSPATLWALDRITFRRLLMERTSRKRRLYEKFLETVPLLKSLEPYERQKIADALESVTYEDGDVIIRQGDNGDDFYLIEQGSARVMKTGEDGVEREYPAMSQGGYFGELALLDDRPRQATVISQGRIKCARMTKDAFDRLLGPVINIIRREAGNYSHIPSLS